MVMMSGIISTATSGTSSFSSTTIGPSRRHRRHSTFQHHGQ